MRLVTLAKNAFTSLVPASAYHLGDVPIRPAPGWYGTLNVRSETGNGTDSVCFAIIE